MVTLEQLRSSRSHVRALANWFGLDLDRATNDLGGTLSPITPFEAIGGDDTGGVFLAYGPGKVELRPVLYSDGHGQAGRIAGSLHDLLALVVFLPEWHDVLHFSGGGNLEEMRRAAHWVRHECPRVDGVWKRFGIVSARFLLSRRLGLSPPEDVIAALHREVSATDVEGVGTDGTRSESLFNTFTAPRKPSR